MEELLKQLLKEIKEDLEVDEVEEETEETEDEAIIEDAKLIAHTTRILFNAHLEEGFTEKQALTLVTAIIKK